MKIAHYLKKLHLTGGTKVLMQHQMMLRELGHETRWFVKEIVTDFDFGVPVTQINNVDEISSYLPNILIVNKPKDYWEVKTVKAGHLVYLSQAFEIDHMNIRRVKKKKVHSGFPGNIAMDFKWWLKKRRIHKLYAEPTEKWCVSPYLMEVLKPYKCPTRLVRNSFDADLYNLSNKKKNSVPVILSVGDYSLSRKNMPFLFNALANVTEKFHLIRVSPNQITEEERNSCFVSEFHSRIPETQLAELYRKTDILISTSTDEGFGLPVLESMACGTLCILSDIGAYKCFANIADEAPEEYALFFDSSKPEELTDLLDKVLISSERYENIRKNGITLSSFYTRDKTVSDLKIAIEELTQ